MIRGKVLLFLTFGWIPFSEHFILGSFPTLSMVNISNKSNHLWENNIFNGFDGIGFNGFEGGSPSLFFTLMSTVKACRFHDINLMMIAL